MHSFACNSSYSRILPLSCERPHALIISHRTAEIRISSAVTTPASAQKKAQDVSSNIIPHAPRV